MMDIERICRETIKTIAIESGFSSNFNIKPISTEGANYTSQLFITTLKNGQEDVNLFVKVAAIGPKLREQAPMKMYEIENYFYTQIVKAYRVLEEENSVPDEHRLKLPKFYGCNPKEYEETIVLEDLTSKGFKTHDRLQVVDWDYASAAITELAKFHALSITYQEKNPEEFESEVEKLKIDFKPTDQHQLFYKDVINNTLAVTNEENKEKLKAFLEDAFLQRDSFEEFFQPLRRPVITHGDYRPSNLMHKVLKDGSIELVPVDFQTLKVGCLINDLMYFIFTATDEEFRRKHHQRLLDLYYTQLSEAMKRLGLDPEEKYSREDFEFELKEKQAGSLACAVFVLPIVMVDAKDAPKVHKDMDLSSFTIRNPGELYAERLNGIINDHIRWGVKLQLV